MPKLTLILTRPLVLPQHVDLDTERVTLGRSKSCTCLIEDRFLSRTHAEILARDGKWFLRDCGSANGTFVNGTRIDREVEFRHTDVVTIGDTEIRIGGTKPQDEITQVGVDAAPAPTSPPAPAPEPEQIPAIVLEEGAVRDSAERTMIVHKLALELLGERSMGELFEVILDHVMSVLRPSRVAIALLSADGESLEIVASRGNDDTVDGRLTISRTLLAQIVEERKVVAFTDVGSEDGEIPESMVVQGIYSALGAPLLVEGRVLGVLYVDYRLTDRVVSEDDAQLAAQIARVAALKLESTRLRETALEKERLDEALRVARAIQMRLLPRRLKRGDEDPRAEVGATVRPAGQVGGGFYDFLHTSDGKLYFCLGDASGEGIPAAMLMAVSRAMFRVLFMGGGSPGSIMTAVNRELARESEPGMSVVAFCGVLDLATGELRASSGGTRPPLLVDGHGATRQLAEVSGHPLGLDERATFDEVNRVLRPGDAICIASDGVLDATNDRGERFSESRLRAVLERDASREASDIVTSIVTAVDELAGDTPQADDLALLIVRYRAASN